MRHCRLSTLGDRLQRRHVHSHARAHGEDCQPVLAAGVGKQVQGCGDADRPGRARQGPCMAAAQLTNQQARASASATGPRPSTIRPITSASWCACVLAASRVTAPGVRQLHDLCDGRRQAGWCTDHRHQDTARQRGAACIVRDGTRKTHLHQEHTLKHFWFVVWPDHGVPVSPRQVGSATRSMMIVTVVPC